MKFILALSVLASCALSTKIVVPTPVADCTCKTSTSSSGGANSNYVQGGYNQIAGSNN
jgi:hypothetical protein